VDSDVLASAIRTCLSPEAVLAAQKLADRMSGESGVRDAVNSFHRNLPWKDLSCDFLSRKPAVWRYEYKQDGKQTFLKLSYKAACILMEHKKLVTKNLKL
jgi:sterol 3beta-glucosyltransferase